MSTSDFALSIAASLLAVITCKLAGFTQRFLWNIVGNVVPNLARVLEKTERLTLQLIRDFREVIEASLSETITLLSRQDYIITLNLAQFPPTSAQGKRSDVAISPDLQRCLTHAMASLLISIYLTKSRRIRLSPARVRILHS